MTNPEVTDTTGSADGRRLPRLTRRAFTDLAIWMMGFGLLVGVAFPFGIMLLDVPARLTLRPAFFAVTIACGLVVGGVNFCLARSVVGLRLRLLSSRMSYVGEALQEASYTGDRSRSTPETSRLPVDSADALGDVAASFNHLLEVLAASQGVEDALSSFNRSLAEHPEIIELADAALAGFLGHGQADAGALCIARGGDLRADAAVGLDGDRLARTPELMMAMQPEGGPGRLARTLLDDDPVLGFEPAVVLTLPLVFKASPVGIVVLAYRRRPQPDTLRLLEHLRNAAGLALDNALAYERFQYLAAIDPLTGAYNRRFGLDRLAEEWGRAVRAGTSMGLLAFDLDHFKVVNDTYGHLAGDVVLRDALSAAAQVLRDGDVLVRAGGEEFLAVLPGAEPDDVREIGERLRRAVEDVEVVAGAAVVRPTISLGATSRPAVAELSPDQLTHIADTALYAAKRSGRNRLVYATELTDVALPAR